MVGGLFLHYDAAIAGFGVDATTDNVVDAGGWSLGVPCWLVGGSEDCTKLFKCLNLGTIGLCIEVACKEKRLVEGGCNLADFVDGSHAFLGDHRPMGACEEILLELDDEYCARFARAGDCVLLNRQCGLTRQNAYAILSAGIVECRAVVAIHIGAFGNLA